VIDAVASHLLALPAWLALLAVFALPGLESSAFVGFVFPGEIALILGGVLASQGKVPLAAVLAAGVAGAAIGDSVGYAVGRRYGRRMLEGTLGRWVAHDHFDRAEAFLSRRGGSAVFFGRFTAALRVMVPGLAGMSRLRYRTFFFFNVTSALCWGVLSVLVGYVAGANWRQAEHVTSRAGLLAVAAVVLVLLGRAALRRLGRSNTTARPREGRPT
jgi:undecaprenyl-diphosphatase